MPRKHPTIWLCLTRAQARALLSCLTHVEAGEALSGGGDCEHVDPNVFERLIAKVRAAQPPDSPTAEAAS